MSATTNTSKWILSGKAAPCAHFFSNSAATLAVDGGVAGTAVAAAQQGQRGDLEENIYRKSMISAVKTMVFFRFSTKQIL